MKKQKRELWLAIIALCIRILAATFTGLQWYEAREARIDARADSSGF
jgi:hypothetical protein